jgi:drug/metabolite transporter (DMT)-like permease
MSRPSRRLTAQLLLLAVVFIWGSSFAVVKDALRDISPLLFNLIRMCLAFVCLAVFYRGHIGRIDHRAVASGAVVGFCLAMGYAFQTTGLALTTPSKSAFITGFSVVLVPLLAATPGLRPASASPPRWNAWTGALLALGGITLLTAPAKFAAVGVSSPASVLFGFDFGGINMGDLLTLAGALGFALHVIALAHTSPRVPFEQLALLQIGFCAVFMAIGTPLAEHSFIHITLRLAVAFVIAGVLATAVAFTVQSWAQRYLATTQTALLLAMEPVFAAITSLVVLGERLSLRASVGALLILAGIALTELVPYPVQPTTHEALPQQ